MPIDLLEDEIVQKPKKMMPVDLLADEMPLQEKKSYGKSLREAPGKVIKDLGDLLFERIKEIPGYIEKSKTEVPGIASNLLRMTGKGFKGAMTQRSDKSQADSNLFNIVKNAKQQPVDPFVSQLAAGLADLGESTFNFPHNVSNYAANRLNLIPEDINEKIQMGRMPSNTKAMINQQFGQPEAPGEALGRGLTGNINAIIPMAGIAAKFNPMKLTSKNITKDVIETRHENKKIYNEKYENFLNDAQGQGLGTTLPNAAQSIDFHTALINEPKKVKTRVNEFRSNPDVVTAHEAKKDLLKIQRKLNKKNETQGLIGNEVDQLDAVGDAIGKIESNMFTDKTGKVNDKFANDYREIQEGYKKEVLPYTKNKAINEYLKGERLEDQLVKSLMSGKFPAQRGKAHTPLMIRRNFPSTNKLAGGSGLGVLGALLYESLFGNNDKH